MRYRALALLLAAGLVGVCLAEKTRETEGEAPIHKGLDVHEWSVFTIHDDLDLANADMRAEWDGMPKFFFGQMAGRELPRDYSNIIVKKPVIFFHTPDALALELRVDFPGGMPAVWWPMTHSPALQGDGCPSDAKRAEPFRFLEWRVRLKAPAKGEESDAKLRAVDSGHWMEALRAVKADDVLIWSESGFDRRRGLGLGGPRGGEHVTGYEREKFIYYDGLIPVGKLAKLAFDKDVITLANSAGHALFDVTVVDRRWPEHPRVARLAKLAAKAKPEALEFQNVNAKTWSASAQETLVASLKDAGLFEDEAKALADVWKRDFFQADGLTLFYRLPQDEYERLLPMKMSPRPEKLTRVGLVLHAHCEPDLTEKIARLVADLADADFATRESAGKRLEEIGRAAYPALRRLREKATAPETQRRLDELLEHYDARKAITP
jgi:hypothetical protein